MAWDLLEALGNVVNVLDLFSGSSSSARLNYNNKSAKKRKSKYFTEKVSSGLIAVAAVFLFIVFKDPLPEENYVQTLIVISLIGIAISSILFFLLNVMELYYFKSLFKLLFFSGSVIVFFISLVLCVYFRSGLFL
ncbi:branched-chain amino acid ABC transporter substrate-binding protein [Chryseobacterium sp. RP-3-3]|uniref:Branched-chain amino acid ABC transporter substrate-binding protein n=1 Tax=Chryseobacterium antibioticum TaxID=2728847 RepID=A0A7Y0FSC3_9FLAO|nr:branched-chain amino acid ABC transporter substrate-binding protein [Chryseobacterium antibioticum]NML71098.1 branched-chain amino acid ABC transporter substrate-binding protein [Chryseobacterium antibioticum]